MDRKASLFETSKALSSRLVKPTSKKSDYCSKKLTFLNLLGVVAAGTIIYLYWVKDILVRGTPPTFLTYESSKRLTIATMTAAGLEIIGFIGLNQEITSIVFAVLYIFAITWGLCDAAYVASRSTHSGNRDDFNQIVEFVQYFYLNITKRRIPKFIEDYQRNNRCCAWGIKGHWWSKWAKELNSTDLPDSCCRVYYKNCGKGILPRRPSGYSSLIQATDYADSQEIVGLMRSRFNMDRWDVRMTEIKRYWLEKFKLEKTPYFEDPSVPVPSWYFRLIDEEFALDYDQLRQTEYSLGFLISNFSNNQLLFYFSRGLEESSRIKHVVWDQPCELTRMNNTNYKLPDRNRGVNVTEDVKILEALRAITMFVPYYGVSLAVIYLLMLIVFIYYFQNIKAKQLVVSGIPVDFQETSVTPYSFVANPSLYIGNTLYDSLSEVAENKRTIQTKIHEELKIRYTTLIGLHKLGLSLKENKITQPPPITEAEMEARIKESKIKLQRENQKHTLRTPSEAKNKIAGLPRPNKISPPHGLKIKKPKPKSKGRRKSAPPLSKRYSTVSKSPHKAK